MQSGANRDAARTSRQSHSDFINREKIVPARTNKNAAPVVSTPFSRVLQSVASPNRAALDAKMTKEVIRTALALDPVRAEPLGARFRPPVKLDPDKLRIDTWVRLDFDLDLDGKPLGDGTLASDAYGLSMSNPVGNGPAYVRATTFGTSTTNVVSIHPKGVYPAFYAKEGAIDVVFDRPTDSVSVDAYPINTTQCPETLTFCPSRPYMEAYDAQGALLAKALYPGNVPFSFSMGDGWQTIRIDRTSRDISRIRISCQQCGCTTPNKAVFDNLSYHFQLP
ncbi:MAG: hypothetical protein EKK55_08045 [Rhodocyclaceae bacterium]|nr:MAG: hypothetical protein EKK55_08045 [Rhodocyclaceae bacterium]